MIRVAHERTRIMNEQILPSPTHGWKLTAENFDHTVLQFRERQAGVSVIFDPESNRYTYNAYCLETKLLKELFTCEFEFLEDALELVNSEFGTWEIHDMSAKKGCGTCVAK
jgi:hypothetical protein